MPRTRGDVKGGKDKGKDSYGKDGGKDEKGNPLLAQRWVNRNWDAIQQLNSINSKGTSALMKNTLDDGQGQGGNGAGQGWDQQSGMGGKDWYSGNQYGGGGK